LAFREKLLWASFVATLVIWGQYFIGFVAAIRRGEFDIETGIGEFVAAVVLLVIVQVIAAGVLALVSGREADAPADDRERHFALAAYRPAYFVLSAVVIAVMLGGPALLRILSAVSPVFTPDMAPALTSNVLLAGFVLAELVHDGAQLIRYRRGG
jgi:hypothetical protein